MCERFRTRENSSIRCTVRTPSGQPVIRSCCRGARSAPATFYGCAWGGVGRRRNDWRLAPETRSGVLTKDAPTREHIIAIPTRAEVVTGVQNHKGKYLLAERIMYPTAYSWLMRRILLRLMSCASDTPRYKQWLVQASASRPESTSSVKDRDAPREDWLPPPCSSPSRVLSAVVMRSIQGS